MGMPVGVCATTSSLLRRAWTTSAGRACRGSDSPRWYSYSSLAASLVLDMLSLGLRWVGRGSPAPFRPLPFFPATTLKKRWSEPLNDLDYFCLLCSWHTLVHKSICRSHVLLKVSLSRPHKTFYHTLRVWRHLRVMLMARRRAPLSLAPIVLLLLHLPVPTRAKSDGQGVACDDATASLCSYECPEHAKQSSVPWATLNANGRFEPCCPYGMDRVAPPTRNAAYRIHLDGIRGTTKIVSRTHRANHRNQRCYGHAGDEVLGPDAR